jgi:lysozyme
MIEREEGCVLRVYLDNHNFPTAGVGHLVRAGDGLGPVGTPITQAQADAFLASDLAEVERALAASVRVSLTQNQYDALCDFGFNCGSDDVTDHHSVVRILNAGDYAGAAKELELFDHSAGVEDALLLARRKREETLFLTPDGETPAEPHPWDLSTTQGLQRILNALGASPRLSVDGAFGAHTKAALVAFQAAHGLTADGVPGPKTRAALATAIAAVHQDA